MASSQKEAAATQTAESRNEVVLVGVVSGAPEVREMPSGDLLGTCRVVVARDVVRPRSDGKPGPSVDVIDCAAWSPRARRTVGAWEEGDLVEVRGALRRRFYKQAGATASRVEVEVSGGRRLWRAANG